MVGLSLMGYSMSRSRTFLGLGLIGLLAVASGAWFAIGPFAWPVLYGTGAYVVGASPLRELAYVVGYALGPGLILALAGGIAWGSETASAVDLVGTADEVAPAAAPPVASAAVGATQAGAAPTADRAAAPAVAPERAPAAVPEADPAVEPERGRAEEVPPAEDREGATSAPNEDPGGATMPA